MSHAGGSNDGAPIPTSHRHAFVPFKPCPTHGHTATSLQQRRRPPGMRMLHLYQPFRSHPTILSRPSPGSLKLSRPLVTISLPSILQNRILEKYSTWIYTVERLSLVFEKAPLDSGIEFRFLAPHVGHEAYCLLASTLRSPQCA